MHSLAAAARLLERCDSIDACGEMLRELGFSDLLPLGPDQREALGLDKGANRSRLAIGTGALRALVIAGDSPEDPRPAISLVAARLASHAPQLLWLIVAIHVSSDTVAIAAVERHGISGQLTAHLETELAALDHANPSDEALLNAIVGITSRRDDDFVPRSSGNPEVIAMIVFCTADHANALSCARKR